MSLIFGINLCDRIYLAADTRLSYFIPGFSRPIVNDCIQKIEILNDDDLVIAVAGDVKLAKFIVNKLKEEDIINHGINHLYENIEDWISKRVDDYLKENSHARACLLFGGIDKGRKKEINGKKLIDLTKEFQDNYGGHVNLKRILYQATQSTDIVPESILHLKTADSKIFAVLINTKKANLEIIGSEWGDFLTFGPNGFNKNNLSREFFGKFEFEIGAGDINHDRFILAEIIKTIEETLGFETVGGGVLHYGVNNWHGAHLITGDIWQGSKKTGLVRFLTHVEVIKGKICIKDIHHGKFVPLTSFLDHRLRSGKYSI